MIIIEATRLPYDNPHGNGHDKISTRMRCDHPENKKLHKHYQSSIAQIADYWNDYFHLSGTTNFKDFIHQSLKYQPIKKRMKKGQAKQKVLSSPTLSHKVTDGVTGKARTTGWYTHYEIFDMMNEKIYTAFPGPGNLLADFNEAQCRRFNNYLNWMIQWDEKFNQSIGSVYLENYKVKLRWV